MVTLEATQRCILRGYAQYNPGDRIAVSDEEAIRLLDEFPDGWRECRREDAITKAPNSPSAHKMVKQPEKKK